MFNPVQCLAFCNYLNVRGNQTGAETTFMCAHFSLCYDLQQNYMCMCVCPTKLNLLLESPRVVNDLSDNRAIGVYLLKLYQVHDFITYKLSESIKIIQNIAQYDEIHKFFLRL